MSSYEDYTTTSAHYDATREPIGTEVILGCLARGGRPLVEQVLVDAGCGTGNYSAALLGHVARIEAIDTSVTNLEAEHATMLSEHKGATEAKVAAHEASEETRSALAEVEVTLKNLRASCDG